MNFIRHLQSPDHSCLKGFQTNQVLHACGKTCVYIPNNRLSREIPNQDVLRLPCKAVPEVRAVIESNGSDPSVPDLHAVVCNTNLDPSASDDRAFAEKNNILGIFFGRTIVPVVNWTSLVSHLFHKVIRLNDC